MKVFRNAIFLALFFLVLNVNLEAQVNQDSPWPMFRHDVKHTGASPYTGPAQPTLHWAYQTNDGVASSPAIGSDGTIYIGSGWFWFIQEDSALYAINPDGTLKWRYVTDGGIFSSPAVDQNGDIYFGSLDGHLYSIEDSVTYAKFKWRVNSEHKVMNSPLITDDGSVFFGALNFRFLAVSAAGDLKWWDQVGWCVFSSPALDDQGRIIVGSKDHNLYAYNDLGTGFTRDWNYPIGTWYDGHCIDASPAIGPDGNIYFASDQYGAAGHSQDPTHIDTSIYSVTSEGEYRWEFVVGDGVESSPAVGKDGMIYFGSYDSCFYAIRDEGDHAEFVWKYETGGVIDASPAIGGDGTVYIGSRDSTMYAFNPDGSVLWTYETGGDIESSVAINGDGIIYFGAMDGKVYALGDVAPDAGPIEMDIPAFINPDSTVNPTVTVQNFRASQSSFDVELIVDTNAVVVYSDIVNVANLDGGTSTMASFAPWNVGTAVDVEYNVNVVTLLSGDGNRYNDTLLAMASTGQPYLCGDVNMSGSVNILDITFLTAYLYKGGPIPSIYQSGDVDGSGTINILDITFLISYLYKSGPVPHCGL